MSDLFRASRSISLKAARPTKGGLDGDGGAIGSGFEKEVDSPLVLLEFATNHRLGGRGGAFGRGGRSGGGGERSLTIRARPSALSVRDPDVKYS